MTQNGKHKPTINGVIKGRPGKGRVLSLGQRTRCYAGHAMTPENTFRYTPKGTKATPKPLEREWCRQCRADSRKRGRVKRLAAAKTEARLQAKAVKAELTAAMPKPKASSNGKRAQSAVKASGGKAKAPPRAAVAGKAKLKGQARIDAELAALTASKAAA